MNLRVVKQGAGLIVLGTDQVVEARDVLPSDVVGWDHSERGLYARRQGQWRACAEPPYAPKDARPAVQFVAVRRSADPCDRCAGSGFIPYEAEAGTTVHQMPCWKCTSSEEQEQER